MRIDDNHRYLIITTLMAIALAMLIIIATNSWGKTPVVDYNERHHQELLHEIAILESGNKNVPCGYSASCDEIGVYQFRPSSWEMFKKKSNMVWLDIYDEQDQRHLADWCLRRGYGNHWATFKRAEQNVVTNRYLRR